MIQCNTLIQSNKIHCTVKRPTLYVVSPVLHQVHICYIQYICILQRHPNPSPYMDEIDKIAHGYYGNMTKISQKRQY